MTRKILVVDDEENIVFLIKRILEMEGYEVLCAYNGKDALAILKDNPDINLLITDYMMPEFDGLEVLRFIRTSKELKDMKVIFLTVSDFQDTIDEALKLGIDDYITKPFDVHEILISVSKVLGE